MAVYHLRYNETNKAWERSSDGTTYTDLEENFNIPVAIGAFSKPSATPRLYIRGSGGSVAAFPTIAAADWVVLENNGNANVNLICSATGSAALKVTGSGDGADDGKIRYDRNTRQWEISSKGTTVRLTISDFGLEMPAITTPSTPASGFGRIYVKTVAGKSELHYLSDTGVETKITTS